MPHALLVTHRGIDQPAGPAARWQSLARRLGDHGWRVTVVCAPAREIAAEYGENEGGRRRVALRARVMSRVGRLAGPAFGVAGLRPEAFPLSMTWLPRAVRDIRSAVDTGRPDVVVATGPPHVALLAARAASSRRDGPPLVVELRDLWAGNPSFDRDGPVLRRLERWVFRGAAAVVTCTPEAAADVRQRHPALAARVAMIPNGFEPELLALRDRPLPAHDGRRVLLHSGTLTPSRPLSPLLAVLGRKENRERWRLALHGHLSPETHAELAAHPGVDVEVIAPSGRAEAIERIAAADATLVSQGHEAGDATAVASKVYEYLAVGRPVLCVTDGGATEALLRRLGADEWCARLDDEASIADALLRLGDSPVEPLAPDVLARYSRAETAAAMAALLDGARLGARGNPYASAA